MFLKQLLRKRRTTNSVTNNDIPNKETYRFLVHNKIITHTVNYKHATDFERTMFPQTYEARQVHVMKYLSQSKNIPLKDFTPIPKDQLVDHI